MWLTTAGNHLNQQLGTAGAVLRRPPQASLGHLDFSLGRGHLHTIRHSKRQSHRQKKKHGECSSLAWLEDASGYLWVMGRGRGTFALASWSLRFWVRRCVTRTMRTMRLSRGESDRNTAPAQNARPNKVTRACERAIQLFAHAAGAPEAATFLITCSLIPASVASCFNSSSVQADKEPAVSRSAIQSPLPVSYAVWVCIRDTVQARACILRHAAHGSGTG